MHVRPRDFADGRERTAFPFVKWGRARLDNDGIHSTHTAKRAEGMAQGARVDGYDEKKLFLFSFRSPERNVYRNQGGARWISDSISPKVFFWLA